MESDSWILFIVLLILLVGSAYFSAAETAFAASSGIRIKSKAENGDKRAKNALYILENFDKALSALLIGNNIMNIGVASITTLIVTKLWGAGYVVWSTIVVTIVVFLLSEMFPKSFANDKPEVVAMLLAGSVRVVMKVLTPVSFFFNSIGKVFTRILGADKSPTVTEDELYDIIESIKEEGIIEEGRGKLIYSALEFDDITAQEILTSRVSVIGIESSMDCQTILNIIKSNKISRLPVYKETLDDIIGTINIRQYIKGYLKEGDSVSITEMMSEPYFVPKKKSIDDLFREMSEKRIHMAVVTDDYGGTMGIVTMEDILEELVGEIWDEDDDVREDFKPLGGDRYEVSGDLNILDAFEMMGYNGVDADSDFKPAGSWVQENIDEIPKKGSIFVVGDITVKILQIDNHQHIKKIILKVNEKEPEEES